jgi:hypothetical protein
MADQYGIDVGNALSTAFRLHSMKRDVDSQNALAQALPQIQSDPQNAFTNVLRSGNADAITKFSDIYKRYTDAQKTATADRIDALGTLAADLLQHPEPMLRKALALSQSADLAKHGITPDQIANFDYSDGPLLSMRNRALGYKGIIDKESSDRDFGEKVRHNKAAESHDAATLGETNRHNRASEANAAQTGEFGKGMTGRAYNILAMGLKDPAFRSTPEYATAWQILSNPRVDPNTGTMVIPDLSAFAAPTAPNGTPAPLQQRMPSVQAFAPPNPSQAEALSAGYANRLEAASKVLDNTGDSLTNPIKNVESKIPLIGNYAVGSKYQQADQAARDFINAQLRRESGAAIAESEFENARKQYLPQPGDSAAVKKQKREARARAVRNMQLSAGNTLLPPGVFQQASPPKNAPIVPQNQGFGAPAPTNDPLGIR